MILDIDDLDQPATLTAQVVVVGTGIAGAEVALRLARHGHDVLVLESGRRAFDPAIQALNDVAFAGKRHRRLDPDAGYHPYLPPGLRGVSRVRQFGGTSTVWTGKWKLFQRSDFDGRDWVPDSDWPIGYDDLIAHYRSAARDYGFRDLEAEAGRAEVAAFRDAIAPAGLKLSSFYWEASPTRTVDRFAAEMRDLPGLRIVLGATATELLTDGTGRRVVDIACRSMGGRSLTVRAGTVVLATGGLETPRLLLASDRVVAGGIGNAHDLVGRFYSDHPKHHTGLLHPGPLTRRFAAELQYAPKPRCCLCFALDDRTQREHRLLEHVIYLKPIHATGLARRLHRLKGPWACRDANGPVTAYRVKFVTEQVPNAASRVTLSRDLDPLGVRRAVLDWRFTQEDRRSLDQVRRLVERRFAAAGIGRFDFGDDPPTLDGMTDAAHQMGTTRMASSPARGVVDADCRVHGTENLYVAGSAVFPTGPSYSPTFTILALARRLAEHLASRALPRPADVPATAAE